MMLLSSNATDLHAVEGDVDDDLDDVED